MLIFFAIETSQYNIFYDKRYPSPLKVLNHLLMWSLRTIKVKLNELLGKVKDLHEELYTLPSNEGLLLRPSSLEESARRVKFKIHQVASKNLRLESITLKKRGGKRQDSKFRSRVGKKADRLKKVRCWKMVFKSHSRR